ISALEDLTSSFLLSHSLSLSLSLSLPLSLSLYTLISALEESLSSTSTRMKGYKRDECKIKTHKTLDALVPLPEDPVPAGEAEHGVWRDMEADAKRERENRETAGLVRSTVPRQGESLSDSLKTELVPELSPDWKEEGLLPISEQPYLRLKTLSLSAYTL
ncbi:hypothetical protein KIPB_011799, partial [Kipferlia bialata]